MAIAYGKSALTITGVGTSTVTASNFDFGQTFPTGTIVSDAYIEIESETASPGDSIRVSPTGSTTWGSEGAGYIPGPPRGYSRSYYGGFGSDPRWGGDWNGDDLNNLVVTATGVSTGATNLSVKINVTYVLPNSPPTTSLTTPTNATTLTTDTPALTFKATDPDGDDVTYQVQVSTDNTFASTHTDALSTAGTGFSGSDPYSSGSEVTYTVQTGLSKGMVPYYWRVRAKDPSGSNSFGDWSTVNMMKTENIPPVPNFTSTGNITSFKADITGGASGYGITDKGTAYGLTSNPTISGSKVSNGSNSGGFTSNISGLSSNTTYNVRIYATNEKGTAYSSNQTFKTLPISPSVSTGAVGSITLTGATVTGSVITNTDSVSITERGVCYATTATPTTANSKKTSTGSPFNASLTGLTNDTTYYVRSYIIWSGGTVYGSQVSFKTQGKASVVLNTPTNNGGSEDTKSKLEFTGTDPDNDRISYQLQLHTSNSFTSPLLDVLSSANAGFLNTATSNTDPFFSGDKIRYTMQTDLSRGTSYWWRVRGIDPAGSDTWGNWSSTSKFTVDPINATVSVDAVHDILDISADVDVSLVNDGGSTITEIGVVYSTSPTPTTSSSKKTGSGTSFTASITGLTGATKYYVRAYAINSKGTSYSGEVNFTTVAPITAPALTTADATLIKDVTAYLGGEVTSDGTKTVTERGVCFSDTDSSPTTSDRTKSTPGTTGAFSVKATGLTASTLYYYRSYAINSFGTGYGAVKTFTTDVPFIPDVGDGNWVWSAGRSQATIGRTQPTDKNSSVNLPLADMGLENGKKYTFSIGDIDYNFGSPSIVIERFNGATAIRNTVAPNSNYTFTYNQAYSDWSIRIYVTAGSTVAENITVSIYEMYLAQEDSFSEFIPFTPKGAYEVKIVNNEIIDKRRQDIIDSIYSKIYGISYFPFNVETEGLGWFETGDRFILKDDSGSERSVVVFNSSLTVDGGIRETLFTEAPDKTETDYKRAGNITKVIKNTQIVVDKQQGEINSIVSDVHETGGFIDNKFSLIHQDIEGVKTTVQGAGGVNLVKNSVMYAFDDDGLPNEWTTSGSGSLAIEASPESLGAGAVSGNAFTLSNNKTATQTVIVRKDVDFIEEKTYYSFSAKVKKGVTDVAYVQLSNRNETHKVDLINGVSYFWEAILIEGLLPQDDHYDVEFFSATGSTLQVTDVILAPGESRHEWTQASGELSNTQVAITKDGMTIRSAEFKNNYTKITALGFEVHKQDQLGDRIFGFNDDETNVSKLKADNQIAMASLKTVPIDYGDYKGWAFTLTKEGE